MKITRDTPFDIVTAPRRNSTHWRNGKVTWGDLLDWIEDPAEHKECGGYILGKLKKNGERTSANIASRSAVTLDADRADEDFLTRVDLSFRNALIVHSTYQHMNGTEGPRYRLIIPVDRDLRPEEYRPAARQLMKQLGEQYFDRTADEAARFMFKPAAEIPELYETLVIEGEAVSADRLLEDTLIPDHVLKTKRDPFSLAGLAGTFNRIYTDFGELVETYDLPYEHEGSDRWHLVGASSVAGMGEVSDGLWYSHHAGDPVHGHAQTAFDLVRIHRFGEQDAGTSEKTPINRLPSYKSMLDLAAEDPRVKDDLLSDFDKLDDAVAGDEADDSWTNRLAVGRNGKTNDDVHTWTLIRRNDEVFRGLSLNEMTAGIETRVDLPWREKDEPSPTFNRNDRHELRTRIEKLYGFRPERSYLDDMVNATAAAQSYHPIRDYLRGLEWDGVERVETCLPGVRPTRYTRFVARRAMIAAVARIMEPGCKWDHMPILYGKEGLGKSYWIHRISLGFSAALGRIGDKDTLLTMQRSWFMVSDEGHAIKGTSFDAQKEFLTRTEDTFRRPYDVEAQTIKRHSVIWGTTNDKSFLTRAEGNRRFLIVSAEDPIDFEDLTDEYVAQVWAEAVVYYQLGEQWHLTDEESAIAKAERELYTLEDPSEGMVREYLETLFPSKWEDKAPEERAWWYRTRGDELSEKGTRRLEQVCTAQILVEALGRRMGEWRPDDLRSIADTLDRVDGWTALPGKRDVPKYGPQRVWSRNIPS